MTAGDATSGLIEALDLVVLEDDRHYFPAYDAVPVVRADAAARTSGGRPSAICGRSTARISAADDAPDEPRGGRREAGPLPVVVREHSLIESEGSTSRSVSAIMSSLDTSRPARHLTVGTDTVTHLQPARAREGGFPGVAHAAVLAEDPAREPAAARGRRASSRPTTSARWRRGIRRRIGEKEISFMPARVLLQDFTGVPCVVDLAAMRDGIVALGGDPQTGQPAAAGRARHRPLGAGRLLRHAPTRSQLNAELEYHAQPRALRVPALGPDRVPQLPRRAARDRHRAPGQHRIPGARGRAAKTSTATTIAYPDTLVGTDSHTTMVNGLGVVGWGVGGIEAEAAMLGQPSSMLIPQVLGFRLTGALPEGATATDLVLTITEALRKHGVVGKFVEFFGAGPGAPDDRRSRDARQHVPRVRRDGRDLPDRRHDARLPAADRPRRDAGRAGRGVREGAGAVPHRRARRTRSTRETIELDLATVEPSLAGRGGRRIACRCRRRSRRSRRRCRRS